MIHEEMIGRKAGSAVAAIPLKVKIVIILAVIGIAAFFFMRTTRTFTTVTATFKGYEKIDKLYTSFTVVPLVGKSYSGAFLGAVEDYAAFYSGSEMKGGGRMNGYVIADYELAIGYDDVSKLIGQFVSKPCPSNSESLPAPKILSLKANVHPPVGGGKKIVHLMYVSPERRKLIIESLMLEMKQTGQWDKLVARGKDVLNTYISLYCGEK